MKCQSLIATGRPCSNPGQIPLRFVPREFRPIVRRLGTRRGWWQHLEACPQCSTFLLTTDQEWTEVEK